MNILFVDDIPALRRLYQLGLSRQGHHVATAAGGGEAIQAVRGNVFDIIIMDLEMPRMNGWEAIRKIRALPQGQKTFIVIFTSAHLLLPPEQMHQKGADGILNKPLTPRELLTYVSQMGHHH
jgi:two-component system alkaline phosphatase synthesis response regulator PhoP